MDIETTLRSFNRKMITIYDLETLFHTGSEAALFDLVSAAVSADLLKPVKNSGTNGNRRYPMFLKYRITVTEVDLAVQTEIDLLHPALRKNGYLRNKPEHYVRYRDPLQKLNRYLFGHPSTVPISKKERSFEIFGEEKQLEETSFVSLLNQLRLTADFLRYYETPEYCFNDYIPVRKEQMTLLICENKDIWFNIRRRMYEDGCGEIFGQPVDGVVYGCGNKVSEADALSTYTHFLGTENVRYLYWGDIDRAGLNIFLSLRKYNPELQISLFVAAYEAMLDLSRAYSIPDSADHREQLGDYESLKDSFSDSSWALLREYIDDNKRIPQEIINYERLLSCMR